MKDFLKENLENKKVLLRLDINLPIVDGEIKDQTRLIKSLPTLNALVEKNAITIVLSHLGRPKGKIDPSLSLRPIFNAMKDLVKTNVSFASNFDELENLVKSAKNKDIILFENIRYFKEEEDGDENFAKKLASFADYYINDAFSCSHRAHASISKINNFLPSAPGLLLKNEVEVLEKLFKNADKPFVGIIGGSKVSSKIDLLKSLISKLDYLIVGGAMANTFFLAQGKKVGKSLVEPDLVKLAQEIEQEAAKNNCKIVLPLDFIVAKEISNDAVTFNKKISELNDDEMMLDIGTETIKHYEEILKNAKTLIWNGPLGAYEFKPFANGSVSIAKVVAGYTKNGLTSVAGGGDVVAAINMADVQEDFSYISTAGGAFLEWLEGKELPGIKALKN